MADVKINPLEIAGPWTDGYVLEREHTLTSESLGHDSFGHPQFDTKWSPLGELIYRLKNRNDSDVVDSIAETAVKFIKHSWNPSIDLIVPVPPSRRRLLFQPVAEIVKAISARLGCPASLDGITKTKETPQLKDIYDYNQRMQLLKDAFVTEAGVFDRKSILLIDDLYRSGATTSVVTQTLFAAGASAVHMLAMTKTRTSR